MATFRKQEKKEAWDLEKVPSVRYEKADGDTDFQYDISEDGVKESIVLKKCPETKEFVFEMKLQGLKAELSEDKKEVFREISIKPLVYTESSSEFELFLWSKL